MKKFTVILMYPDYHANQYGETWCGTVEAEDPVRAVLAAAERCAADAEIKRPEDLLPPVAVFAGSGLLWEAVYAGSISNL